MKKILKLVIIAFSLSLATASYADEIFSATAYTGVHDVGAQIDVAYAGSQLAWINFTTYYWEGNQIWTTGNPPQGVATIGDSDAYINPNSLASNWVLWWANWSSGNGYAVITVDTDNPPGLYAVGTVNCTGAVIWVLLL